MKNYKEIDYYNDFIKLLKDLEKRSRIRVESNQVKPNMIDLIKFSWFSGRLKILIAKYSKGDNIDELKACYKNITSNIEELWTQKAVKLKDGKGNDLGVYILEPYIFMRWMLSLGVLLDVPNNEFNILVDLIKRDEINDKLYDFLISSRIEDWKISDSMSLKKPENSIQEIIDIQDNTECEKNIKEYLNKEWYKTYKYAGFYNSHTKPEDMFLFYGYWAFEVAALAKIKGLDDSSFRTNKYYPNTLL